MPPIFVQRIADGNGVLAPPELALAFPAGWGITDMPQGTLSSVVGGAGQVTGYLQLVPPGGAVAGAQGISYTASAAGQTVDSATAVALGSVTVPTGYRGWVRLVVEATIVASGLTFVIERRLLLRNPSGTVSVSSGAYLPSGGVGAAVASCDETGGTTGSLQAPTASGSVLSLSVKGGGAYAVDWSMWAEALLLPQ